MRKSIAFLVVFVMLLSVSVPVMAEELNCCVIGDIGYKTLQEAVDAATVGQTIKLIADFEQASMISVAKDDSITLDLAGHTITGKDNTAKNFGLIDNRGTLVITDTVGGGEITLKATVNSGWSRYSAVLANTQGTMTVLSGTFRHLGGTDMAYAIDNLTNGSIGDATLTVEGGTIISPYRAIRQFANSTTKTNSLIITGGTIEGTNKAVWLQNSNANANKAVLKISGTANVGSVYLSQSGGTDGSSFTVKLDADCIEGVVDSLSQHYAIKNIDGVYTIVETEKITLSATSVSTDKVKGQAVLVLAAYNGETLLNIKSLPINGDASYTFADAGLVLEGADCIGAFLWNDLETMQPICKAAFKTLG